MDGHFRDEFKKYLEKEYKQNKYLKEDMARKTDSSEDEIVRPISGTTLKERPSNTAVSFIKAEHGNTLKKNSQVKQKNLHDTPTSNCQEF